MVWVMDNEQFDKSVVGKCLTKEGGKSILDGRPVVMNPGAKDFFGSESTPVLRIVGCCRVCSSPIYGPEFAVQGSPVEIRRTCLCATPQTQ